MFRKILSKLHSWTGWIVGFFLLLLSLSGSILVWHQEIDRMAIPEIESPNANVKPKLDKAFEILLQDYPNWDIRFKNYNNAVDQALIFELRRPTERKYVYLHPQKLTVVKKQDGMKRISYWLLKFHYTLLAGFTGKVIILIVGILSLLCLLSGIVIYRHIIVQVFRFRIRWKNLKQLNWNTHVVVGSWSLLFNLLLFATGTWIAVLVVSNSPKPNQTIPETPITIGSVVQMIAKVEEQFPDFEIHTIKLPTLPRNQVTFYGLTSNETSLNSPYTNQLYFNATSGAFEKGRFLKDRDSSERIKSMLIPLHFGAWGGIFSKLLYSLLGLSPALLVLSFLLFNRKRKKK